MFPKKYSKIKSMDNIIPTEEFTEVEGRVYPNPQVGIDETSNFIENLRATQGQQNQEIAQQTYNLGTAVPSVQGGLGAPTDTGLAYFTSRYQTPQTNASAANLRAASQAQAMNEVLANEQAIWKNRYQQAYRDYQRRQYRKANTPRTASPTSPTTTKPTTGGVDENPTDSGSIVNYSGDVSGVSGYYTVISPDGRAHLVDMETGKETVVLPETSNGSGSGGRGWSGGGTSGSGIGGR